MTVSALDAAKHLCQLSDWTISNLVAQKMLYMADMVYLGQSGERLINENFEAWDYGPVLPTLYQTCKAFGSKPIPNIFYGARNLTNRPEGEIIRQAWEGLKEVSPGQLVENTHWYNGAWARRYSPGARGIKITTEDMRDEYRNRTASAAAA